MLQIIIEL